MLSYLSNMLIIYKYNICCLIFKLNENMIKNVSYPKILRTLMPFKENNNYLQVISFKILTFLTVILFNVLSFITFSFSSNAIF